MLFRSEEAIVAWCEANDESRGAILTPEQVWELSKAWYHNRMAADYRGRTLEDVQQIFEELGLTAAFWQA